jgi:diguanylate cyclase (GGDEF)-like protein
MIDALTDIPNRRFFDLRLKEEWRRSCRHRTPFSILILDIDKFKNYNDTYGHPQGDLLLHHVAKTIAGSLRRSSDMAARIGGEEFAVLLADTPKEGAFIVAEHIREQVAAAVVSCQTTGEQTSVTVSIGVNTVIPANDGDVSEFIQQADKNLYTAKDTGRNRVV